VSQTRTCNNGTLSGSCAYAACTVAPAASCSFNGQTVANGASVTAYQSSSSDAFFGCVAQLRTCTKGVLSGTFTHASCSSLVSCTFNGQTVANGHSVTAYQTSKVPFGSQCVSQTRTCNNGALSGSYAYAACTVAPAASCTFNGQTVANGASVTAYQAASVPFGSQCVSQTRTCSNGALSGSYTNAACTVTSDLSCSFGGQTVANGTSVIAYQAPSVPFGSKCVSQTRTCNNGALSGTFTNPSCAVAANLCSALAALNGSSADASGVLQGCLDNAPATSTLELPPGKYDIAHQIHITKPLTLRTQGKTDSMARCDLDDPTCAQLIADPNFSQQWGVLTIGANPPTPGGSLQNVTLDHIIINGNNKARWNGPAGVQLAPPILNSGIGHNLMVFDCSNCRFTNNVLKYGLSATAFGYNFVWPAQGYPAVHNHDVIITNNLIAYNGVHDRSLSWSDGLTMHDGDHFIITANTFIDNTDGQFITGGCTNCIIQRNTLTNSGTFEGGSYVAFNLQAWIYPLTNGTQTSSGDYTGTDISNNIIDCSPNQRCGFGMYLGDAAWGFTPPGTITGGHIHDNQITNAEQGLNVDTFQGVLFEHNSISNSGGMHYTNRGQRLMGACNIAPGAQITFTNNSIALSQCTSERWDTPFEIPNWWLVPAAGTPPTPTGLVAVCSADGMHATLSWNESQGATTYYLRVDDTGNQASGCTAPTVTGPNGRCVSPTDYVNDNATTPTTVTITPGRAYSWWVHSGNAAGINQVPGIGNSFTCLGQTGSGGDGGGDGGGGF
jgi:hypothetical protein